MRYCNPFMASVCTLPGKVKKKKNLNAVDSQVGIHKKETFWGIKQFCIFYLMPWVN